MADEQKEGVSKSAAEPSRAQRAKKPRASRKPLPREQSTIQFPYMDLETAISVARSILSGGGVAPTRDQLAGVMNQVATSGNFVLKIATARVFGLVNFSAGKYELSPIGFDILDNDEKRQKAARTAAFLSVPLYKRTYEEFKGKQLPPRPLALEQAFAKFGVVPKQKANARLAFDKSAAQAGFFVNGSDRLIEPIIGASMTTRSNALDDLDAAEDPNAFATTPRSKPNLSGLHPFIQGLIDTLPAPETNWTVEGRAKWLQAAAHNFDLIYKGSGEIHITAKPGPNSSE